MRKFSQKLTFLPPYTQTYVCVLGGKKCYFYGKFCVRTKWMTLKVLRPEKNFGRLLIPFNIIIWSVYLFKVNNGKTRTISETYSEITIKAPERYQWRRSGVFIVNIVTLTCNKLRPLVRVDWPLLLWTRKKLEYIILQSQLFADVLFWQISQNLQEISCDWAFIR